MIGFGFTLIFIIGVILTISGFILVKRIEFDIRPFFVAGFGVIITIVTLNVYLSGIISAPQEINLFVNKKNILRKMFQLVNMIM